MTTRKQESRFRDETLLAPDKTTVQGQKSLRVKINATERLLSLYNSPFPDAWERAKRAELIAIINGLNEQLARLLRESAEEKK